MLSMRNSCEGHRFRGCKKNTLTFRSGVQLLIFLAVSVSIRAFAFDGLHRVEPTAVGLDPERISAAILSLGETPGCWSVVITRHGALAAESYFSGQAEDLHAIWSVTKSVTSALSGIAIGEGLYPGVEAKMVDFLPPNLVPPENIKKLISLEQLLMMTSGLQWSEDEDWLPWLVSADPAEFILERPVDSLPGMSFNYSSATSHLPSVMLETALDTSVMAFADARIFAPLGIIDWSWDLDPQGYAFGGHGLHWRTEDLAKFGILFLREGTWKGRQLISSSWVEESTSPRFFWGDPWGALDQLDYGYLWWTAEASGYPVFFAWGWGGQFSFCVPDLDLVVATAADGDVGSFLAERQEKAILEVIVDTIIPAVDPEILFRDGFDSGTDRNWGFSSADRAAEVGNSLPAHSVDH